MQKFTLYYEKVIFFNSTCIMALPAALAVANTFPRNFKSKANPSE